MECFCSKARTIRCKIVLLDEQELVQEIQHNKNGQALLDAAFKHLNLLETAYFGLRYLDSEGQTHWLDAAKKLGRQLKGADPRTLYFGVKFYAADPCKLLEEITRYQFFLQVKQDVLQGRLPVSFELAAELGSFIVQSELGDYDPRRHSCGYVSEFRFLSNQSAELENRVAELHKMLVGQLPSVAELNYLDKVKWLEMYGVDLHPVLGEDNVEYFLGLTPSGIVVLRNKNTVGNYYWPRISKIYFKGRYFMLRVTDKNNDESTYGFETPSKAACKHLWKCCVEHRAFFRLVRVSPTTPDMFVPGSRLVGKSDKSNTRDMRPRARTPPTFARVPSRRYRRRRTEGILPDAIQNTDSERAERHRHEIKRISVPQPAQSLESGRRGSMTRNVEHRSDSPRSTRSAPWSQPHAKGLYERSAPASPRSVRSAGPRCRSSSVDSQSSNESRLCKRRKHRARITSDDESELSKCSTRSHRKHRRHRSGGNRRDSGSERDSHSRRHRTRNRSGMSDARYESLDAERQWRQAHRRPTGSIRQANVVNNRRFGCAEGAVETESEVSYKNRNRRHRRHRSRSGSPSDGKKWLSDELKRHLEFDLVDTVGMSDTQLKEIPYTVIQTNDAKQLKIKRRSASILDDADESSRSPPPPYYSHALEMETARNTLNMSSVQLSDAESDRVASGHVPPRMGDCEHFSCDASRRSAANFRSTKYDFRQCRNAPLKINHEHSDSGLGGEHECTYGGEKCNDSAKHDAAPDVKTENGCETSPTDYVCHSKISPHFSRKTHNNDASPVRVDSRLNAFYSDNSHLTHQISSLPNSLPAICDVTITYDDDAGPLRLHYSTNTSTRSMSKSVRQEKGFADSTYQIIDKNQNLNGVVDSTLPNLVNYLVHKKNQKDPEIQLPPSKSKGVIGEMSTEL